MKQQIENIIKKNLPEKKEETMETECPHCKGKPQTVKDDCLYCHCGIQAGLLDENIGFNQALSQINTSLIADEVLKVVVEKIKEEKEIAVKQLAYETDVEIVEYLKGKENLSNDLLNLLTNSSNLDGERSEHLSPNKENDLK